MRFLRRFDCDKSERARHGKSTCEVRSDLGDRRWGTQQMSGLGGAGGALSGFPTLFRTGISAELNGSQAAPKPANTAASPRSGRLPRSGGGGGERLCSPDSLLPVGGKWPRNALKRLYSQASSANNNSNNNNNTNNNNITNNNNNNNKTVTTTTTKKGKNSLFETFSEIDKCTRFLFTCKDTLFKTAVVTD